MDTLILLCIAISVPIVVVAVAMIEPSEPAVRADTGCRVAGSPGHSGMKGLAWLIGGFMICPCHLPITLAVASGLLSGTAAGALLRGHPYAAGALITLAWIAATWRGLRHLSGGL